MTKTLTEELKYLRELEPYLGPSELLLKLILKLEARVDELEKQQGELEPSYTLGCGPTDCGV